MRWSVAIACGVLSVGCRSAPAPVAEARATPEREPPTRVELLPYGGFALASEEPDGWVDLTFGGARVQVRDDEVRIADDLFALRIVLAVQVARGWVFCAEDGLCAASETFLGPLRRVGEFPGGRVAAETPAAEEARGRAAMIDRDGVAWTSDGGPFAQVTALPPAAVRAMLFADARQGAAILDGGALMVTTDGGARWSYVDLSTQEISVIRDPGADPYLHVVEGRLEDDRESLAPLYRSHVLSPRPRSVFDTEHAHGAHLDLDALRFTIIAHRPAWTDGFPGEPMGAHAIVVYQGIAAFEAPRVVRGFAVDLRDGRVTARVAQASTVDALARFGVPYVASDVAAEWRRERSDLSPSESPRMNARFNHGSARGLTLLSLLPTGLGTCTVHDDLIDPPPITTITEEGLFEEVNLNHEGTLTGILLDGAARRRFVVGRIDGEVAVRPLPPETTHVAFADPRRGLAWGDRWTRLLRTLDGGETWHPLPVPTTGATLDGAASQPSASSWRPRPGRCTSDRCLVGDHLVVTGWSPEVQAPRPALALAARGTESAPRRVGWNLNERLPRLTCAASGRPSRLPSAPLVWRAEGSNRAALWTDDGLVVARATERPNAECTVSIAWWGLDEHGLFHGVTRPITPVGERRWCDDPASLWGASLRRDGASLLWHADTGHILVSLADQTASPEVEALPVIGEEHFPFVTSPDGVAVLSASLNPGRTFGAVLMDLRARPISPFGERPRAIVSVERESEDVPDSTDRDIESFALARRGDEVGLAVIRARPTRRVLFFPLRPRASAIPDRLPWVDEGPIPVCTGAPDPRGARIVVVRPGADADASADAGSDPPKETVTLDLSPTTVCLHAFTRVTNGSLVSVTARSDGALVGATLTESSLTPTRCTP